MSDETMNDEAIKKALECCLLGECMSCPIIRFQDCRIMLKDETISLLNRQQAEIERYEKESNKQFDKMKLLDDRTKQRYAELFEEAKEFVRTEAIKEFAERLRKEVANTWFGVCCTGETEEYKEGCLFGLVAKQKHCLCIIEKLLAEMVGEQL